MQTDYTILICFPFPPARDGNEMEKWICVCELRLIEKNIVFYSFGFDLIRLWKEEKKKFGLV